MFRNRSSLFILLAALLANAAIVLLVLPEVSSYLKLTYSLSFGDLYDLIAKNLEQGNGYRVEAGMSNTMLREPAYPLLLSAVFKLAGYGIQQARVVCVLLTWGAALVLLRLGRKITCDAGVALLATVLFLLYPGILFAEGRAGIEIPAIFTVMLFMLGLYSAVERGSLWRYGAAGLLLGLAVEVRSQILLFPVFLLGYFLFTGKGWGDRGQVVVRISVLAVAAGIVMSPWVIRNYILVHQIVPTATVAGVAAQEGLFTCQNDTFADAFADGQTKAGAERVKLAKQLGLRFLGPYYQLFYTPNDEVVFNRALLNHVSSEYRSHPQLLARCATKNLFFNFWFLGKRPESTLVNIFSQTPLIGLALGGIIVLRKQGLLPKAAIALVYVLYIPAVQAPIIAHTRHSMFIVPFLTILAAASLVSVWQTLRKRWDNSSFHQVAVVASGK